MLGTGQRELGQNEEFGCPEAMLDIIHHRKNAINVLAYDGVAPLRILNVTDDRLDCNGSVWCNHSFFPETEIQMLTLHAPDGNKSNNRDTNSLFIQCQTYVYPSNMTL